jgi:hypothetical protein
MNRFSLSKSSRWLKLRPCCVAIIAFRCGNSSINIIDYQVLHATYSDCFAHLHKKAIFHYHPTLLTRGPFRISERFGFTSFLLHILLDRLNSRWIASNKLQ